MRWRNSKERYGKTAMIMHWSVALLFLGAYVTVYFRQWFTEPRTGINMDALHLHLSIGITAMVFVVLRILYKIWDQTPDEVPGSRLEHLAARGVHYMLYAIMIIMPVTGYFGTGLGADYFFLFELPKFNDTALYQWLVIDTLQMDWKAFEKPMDFIHKRGGAYIVWVLIAVHVAAALYHHFGKEDDTMRRMLPVVLKDKRQKSKRQKSKK